MSEKKIKYYYVEDLRLLGKSEGDTYYVFIDAEWVPDEWHYIMDRLIGYDPYEDDDSPYKIGNTEVMDEIEEISEKEAKHIEAYAIVEHLVIKWIDDFKEKKEEWDKHPLWPAKRVYTTFYLNGVQFKLIPESLGLTNDCMDQGFMEHVQGDMKKDLEKYGAKLISNHGELD